MVHAIICVSVLQTSDLRKGSALFDIDKQWSREPNFVLYDFNNPEDIPVNIHNTFDCVVIDPPFITGRPAGHAAYCKGFSVC